MGWSARPCPSRRSEGSHGGGTSVADLLAYEARLNDFAPRHPQSILCLYDIDAVGTGVVFEAMRVHPRIWLSGLVLENTLYERTG